MSAEAEIRSYAERIVRLETERRELASDIKDVKAEAKARGFNVKLIAACVRLMLLEQGKQDAALREHEELDIYLGAVGLLDGVEAQAASPPEFQPASQDEGQPEYARNASDEASAGVSGVVTTGQSEEFVTATGTEEGAPAPVDPVPAPDDQDSPERASENREAVAARHEPDATPAGPVVGTRSGATAGETAPLSPERAARLAAYEAERRANPPPLDPTHPMFAIRFKVRHGRDPGPEDMAGRA